jgi:hypothetical protein
MTAFLSPIGGAAWQFFSNAGVVLQGGKLFTYIAGSSTPQATWTDSTQAVQNANPIVFDAAGRPPNEIWLANGIAYKFILKDANNNTLGTWDNISGIGVTNVSQTEWITSNLVVTFVNASQFSVTGDQRALFPSNRRIQYGLAAGTFYGSVSSSSYDGVGTTTVTILPDSTSLDSSLSFVNYAFLNSVNPSIPNQYIKQGDAINGSPIGNITPSTGVFTNLSSGNVNITGGTITGIVGFSVPDFLIINQGVI